MPAAFMIGHHFSISAFWRRPRHAAQPEASPRAGNILDDHGLAERCPQALGQNARDRVGWTACRVWHDHGERARRIGLRHCDVRDSWEHGSTRCQMQKATRGSFIRHSPE